MERLDQLVSYINENYQKNLSLSDVADHVYLSVPYLSTFFDKYFGMSFLTYYTNIRLRHAVIDLMSSDESIETIALNNGFPDPRAFVSAFRKKYGVPPSIYRKQSATVNETAHNAEPFEQRTDYLYTLAKYLPPRNEKDGHTNLPVSQNFSEEKIDLAAVQTGVPFR